MSIRNLDALLDPCSMVVIGTSERTVICTPPATVLELVRQLVQVGRRGR